MTVLVNFQILEVFGSLAAKKIAARQFSYLVEKPRYRTFLTVFPGPAMPVKPLKNPELGFLEVS
jgi:hypothetical protein